MFGGTLENLYHQTKFEITDSWATWRSTPSNKFWYRKVNKFNKFTGHKKIILFEDLKIVKQNLETGNFEILQQVKTKVDCGIAYPLIVKYSQMLK